MSDKITSNCLKVSYTIAFMLFFQVSKAQLNFTELGTKLEASKKELGGKAVLLVYKDGKIVDVVEKPKNPSCDEAIVGLYCYTYEAFDIIDTLKPSARGEYEVSDINSFMVKNRKGTFNDVGCGWIDAGTHESYRLANQMVTK